MSTDATREDVWAGYLARGHADRPSTVAEVDELEMVCPDSDAYISFDGVYRYRLWRRWGDGCMGVATFVMLNPSTADGSTDDPTIRKCIGFARRWGLHGIRVVNLFGVRSTDPKGLLMHADPIGPENDAHLRAALEQKRAHDVPADLVVAAWGSCGNAAVKRLVRERLATVPRCMTRSIKCLGFAKDGNPRHPLMLSYDTPLVTWGAP